MIVTCRILTTLYPDRGIALEPDLSPLHGFTVFNRSFNNIICTTNSEKCINVRYTGHYFPRYDPEDLQGDSSSDGSHWGQSVDSFYTIPSLGQGSLVVQHQVPVEKIKAANLEKGEIYRVAITDYCLGTRWWTYGTAEELDGVRIECWHDRTPEEQEDWEEQSRNPEVASKRLEWAKRPVVMLEEYELLALVPEVGEVEFEIV